jgi:uncharacterized membrane protein YbhN (UPF0104 family)
MHIVCESGVRYTRLRDFGAFQGGNPTMTYKVAAIEVKHSPAMPPQLMNAPWRWNGAPALPMNGWLQGQPAEGQRGCQRGSALAASGTKRKKWLRFALRAAGTIAIFAFLFRSFSWSTLPVALAHLHYGLALDGVVVGAGGIVLSAYQWRSLLHAERIRFDLADLVNLYMVGIAFSHFLPTGMGGDAVKAMYVGRAADNRAGSASAVLMCRITGFIAMLMIAFPALLIWRAHFASGLIMEFLLLSLIVGVMMSGAMLAAMLLPMLSRRSWARHRIFTSAVQIGNALIASAVNWRAMGRSVLYGVVFWIVAVLNCYVYAHALGMSVPLYFYAMVVPLIALISFLPISINGFGLRESAFVYAFASVHVSATTALLLAFLLDGQTLCFGLIGGCLYFIINRKWSRTYE